MWGVEGLPGETVPKVHPATVRNSDLEQTNPYQLNLGNYNTSAVEVHEKTYF
jgi:hypothetical protein